MSINFANYGRPALEIPKTLTPSPPHRVPLESLESDASFEPDSSESSESFESPRVDTPIVVPEAPPIGVKPTPSLRRAHRVFARVFYYALIAGVWTPLIQWSPILYASVVATHCTLKIV